jgi:hypothetical protein
VGGITELNASVVLVILWRSGGPDPSFLAVLDSCVEVTNTSVTHHQMLRIV